MEKISFLVFNGSALDNNEAIDKCVEKLVENGITDNLFSKLCIEREKEYPTGLPTEIPVALPHAYYENINKNCICVMRLNSPVKFKRMDDNSESVDAKIVFNLAIKDSNKHIKTLQNLMGLFSDGDSLKKILAMNEDNLIKYLEEKVG